MRTALPLRRLALGACFIRIIIPAALPPVNWGQISQAIDPAIPSYAPPEPISGKLSIAGSDTMKPLVRAWVDGLAHQHPDLRVTVVAEGSETGLAALLEHRTQVAAMSRRITAPEIAEFVKEYGYEPSEVPVAGDTLAIFVHKDNPVAGLSLDELDAMFCRERRRGLKYIVDSWGLVGVMDEWFEAPIRLYGRNGRSGTSVFFREEPVAQTHDCALWSPEIELMCSHRGFSLPSLRWSVAFARVIPLSSSRFPSSAAAVRCPCAGQPKLLSRFARAAPDCVWRRAPSTRCHRPPSLVA